MGSDQAATHDGGRVAGEARVVGGVRSRRMTAGLVGVVVIVTSLFLVLDTVLTLAALPLAWSVLTVAGLSFGFRLETLGISLAPLAGFAWLVGGTWLAAVRFRRGEGTRRWLVPIAVPAVAHAVGLAVVNLVG